MRRLSLLALVLLGCGRGNFNDPKTGGASVLTYPLEAKVTTLDPGKVQDVDMSDVLGNVFEGLLAYDERNALSPRLAASWDVTNGGRTYVFHLREARFQSGRPLVADDFRWSWERNLGKPLASPVALDYLGDIVGAKAFAEGRARSISGVEAPDPRTLRVTLDKPRPYFLGNLAYPCAFALDRTKVHATEMRTVEEASGTGPFRLARAAEDVQIDLVAFDGYWAGRPKLAKVLRPVVVDASTRLSGFKNGVYDLVFPSRSDVPGLQADPGLRSQLRLEPRPSIVYFLLNQKGYAPFRDARVRKAFALSLDRRRLVGDVLTGETVAYGLVAPGVPGYRDDYRGLPYDPEGARALLAQAGFPGGKGMPTLELAFRSGRPDSRLACEAAATAWRRELGAPVSPRALEWGALLQQRNHDRLQMGLMSWVGDYLDPQNFLSLLMTSTSQLNHDGFSDAEFDRLCAAADVDGNPANRLALYARAERIAVEQAARIPLYFERQPMLVSPRVKNLRTNLFGLMPQSRTTIGG